jgi:hypothetical protein
LPAVLLTAVPATAYVHYFIVILPLPFFGMARLVELLARRSAVPAATCACVVLAYFFAVDAGLLRTVAAHGGAAGDYGVAYRYKLATARVIDRLSDGHGIVLVDRPGPEYRFLLWNLDPDASPRVRPALAFRIVDSLVDGTAIAGRARAREGPLLVFTAPRARRGRPPGRLAASARGSA